MISRLIHRLLHRETLPYGSGCRWCDGERIGGLLDWAGSDLENLRAASRVLREHGERRRRD